MTTTAAFTRGMEGGARRAADRRLIVFTAAHGGTFRETIAMSKAYAEARAEHGESELLDEIVSAKPKIDHTRYHSAEELRDNGLGHLRDAMALLESEATAGNAMITGTSSSPRQQGRRRPPGARAEREPRRDRGHPADHGGARPDRLLTRHVGPLRPSKE
jgi:hypothetical protein